jgi:type II secretory pathway pseudopilin PulG
MRDHKRTAVASAVRSGFPGPLRRDAVSGLCVAADCRVKPQNRIKRTRAFTLAELLVTTGVLVLLVLLASQLFKSTAAVTTLGHKQMDADAQARQLLDRMALDFAQMVKRSDLDFFAKRTASPNSDGGAMAGNDQIAFYSAVPGYYPATGSQSPISLVAYRVNSNSASFSYNKVERLGKGLVWNGVDPSSTPVAFMPIRISASWAAATSPSQTDLAYELIGPQVFRLEYYYLLKGTATGPAIFSNIPWDTRISGHNAVNGMQDVSAIVVNIAVIDAKSKVLLTNDQIATFSTQGDAHFLTDYTSGMTPGQLRTQWQTTLDGITDLPRPAISGIRLYERFVYLSPPVL